MPKSKRPTTLHEGRHLRLLASNGWEYASRRTASGVVAVIAVTDRRELVLTEQFRPPVDRRVIDLPAGLAGDVPGEEHEAFAQAAKRELLEETGFRCETMTHLADVPSSAGLTDEIISLFAAGGLQRTAAGGGDSSEDITVHVVALDAIDEWLAEQSAEGMLIDWKVYLATSPPQPG